MNHRDASPPSKRTSGKAQTAADGFSAPSVDSLLDQACVDLMQRKRQGNAVDVNEYVSKFPGLAQPSLLLDLIDADLCVSRELGLPCPGKFYQTQFPELETMIQELALMQEESPLVAPPPAAVDQSSEFSIDQGYDSPAGLSQTDWDCVEAPSWFSSHRLVAAGPGHWLVRGRDEQRGIALAMKVVAIPPGVSVAAIDDLLEACETASKIQHPAWVNPMIAKVQNQHFATVRTWHYGRGMPREVADARLSRNHDWDHSADYHKKLILGFASVAFAVAQAHHKGAAHGNISTENLLVDHEGNWKLVDAVANRLAISRYLASESAFPITSKIISLETRRRHDIQDLTKLITPLLFASKDHSADELIARVRRMRQDNMDAAAEIGEILMDYAESDRGDFSVNKRHRGNWLSGLINRMRHRAPAPASKPASSADRSPQRTESGEEK